MKKIISFGDSFVLGSEIPDNHDGSRAWPALVAKSLGYEYQTNAIVGVGNEQIAQQIYQYYGTNPCENTLAVINWTWSMRWDFWLKEQNQWISLGPTCQPSKLFDYVTNDEALKLIDFYNHYLNHSDIWNKFRSLQAIVAAQSYLRSRNIPSVQTYMDLSLWQTKFDQDQLEHYNINRDDSWPHIDTKDQLENLPDWIQRELHQTIGIIETPGYIQELQKITWQDMRDFDGMTFLDWSRYHGFEVTPAPGDHPLAQAHIEAAKLWPDIYQQLIGQHVQ
jgi:hypothetical protein